MMMRRPFYTLILGALMLSGLLTALARPAEADRERPRIEDGTLVADNGRLLRGTRWSLDVIDAVPSQSDYATLKANGLNALHIYAESFAEARCRGLNPGYRDIKLAQMINDAGNQGIYAIVTIGNGSSQHGNGDPNCNHANGTHDPDFTRAFWNLYAGQFANRSHVIYEIQNEPYFMNNPAVAQPSPAALRSLEQEVYGQIRSVAPDTPILLYSYALFHDGPAIMADVQALGGIDWSNSAVAFHGYSGLSATTTALNYVTARGIPVFQTEFYTPAPNDQFPDIAQTELYERTRTSWLTFVDLSVLGNGANFKDPIDQAYLIWVADDGTWPASSKPPIGETITLQTPAPFLRFVQADTVSKPVNAPLFADSTQVTSRERFQVVAVGDRRVALRSESNGRYVWPNANGVLRARWTTPAAFDWLDRADGMVALKNPLNNLFVAADHNHFRSRLIANRARGGGPWEGFVVDDGGAPDLPPNASFTVTCNALACSFNGGASSDDGGIVSYAWTFGDGSSGSGVGTSHTYPGGGTYTARLTVTDTTGQTGTTTRSVSVSPANQPPTASFTFSCNSLSCSFDGGGSSDDGGITSYAWTFGDGGSGSGIRPSHSYGSGGTYTARLTVRDAAGLSNTTSRSVTVSPPTGTCAPTATTLCLGGSRFRVTVRWFNPNNGASGDGQASPFTGDGTAGFFWFFSPENLEVGVKVLDGTTVNDRFWVYHGAITDLQYTLTVTDTVESRVKTYVKGAGHLCGGSDTDAFPGSFLWEDGASDQGLLEPMVGEVGNCVAGPTQACLLGNRFRVEVKRNGVSQPAVKLSDATAVFTFFSPDNPEVFFKILDGGVINSRFWLYFGSITDQSFQVVVTDTVAQTSRTYNPPGPLCGLGDTNAFPSP